MQQLNSDFSTLSFSSSMPQGVIEKQDLPISSPIPIQPNMNMNGSFGNFIPQEEASPYYPSSPMSPVFRQQNNQLQMARQTSLGDQGLGPRNSYQAASPIVHNKRTISPVLNTPISLDGRSSQFSATNSNNQEHHPLASFLPPPPNLDTPDASQQIGRLDNNTGLFLSENDNSQHRSPFVSTQISQGNIIGLNEASLTRERSLSESFLRQPSFGAKSPPPAPASSQILYEDKPSSWNQGPGGFLPAVSSPSNLDRFNNRPPRYAGPSKDAQALLSPRIEMRHAASDGNFNFPSPMPPLASHMSPVASNSQGRFQPHTGSGPIGSPSPSYDAMAQGGPMSGRHSFGSGDML